MDELVIRLDPKTAARLSRLSGEVSAEEIALDAIMERVEELELAPAAITRLKEIEDGPVKPIPHDQAMRDLGLEDQVASSCSEGACSTRQVFSETR